MGAQLEVRVAGKWLSMEVGYGETEMSTCWPGGSDELSWVMDRDVRFRGNELVEAFYGGASVWSGYLLEPDASQERTTARGAWHEAEGFTALDGSGNPTKDPATAYTQALARGLRWTVTGSTVWNAITPDVDVSQGPLTLAGLFDAWGNDANARWGVAPDRTIVTASDPTVPNYQTLPLAGGMGYARDNYASTLVGRYQSSSGYKTVTVTDSNADALHGHVEAIVDLTPRGVITSGKATTILTNMLALGRAIPQWTTGIEVVYGELLNMGGAPLALEGVTANGGRVIRAHGGYELAERLGGRMYVDILIGRTVFTSDGTLVIEPAQLADRTLVATLTRAMDSSPGPGRDVGPSRQAATSSPGAIAFGARTQTGATSLTTGTLTDIPFGAVKEASNGVVWDGPSSSWQIQTGGNYHVVISCMFAPNATGRRNIQLWKNGAVYALEEKSPGALSNFDPTLVLTVDLPCEVGDTLTARALQASGGALNISVAGGDSARHFFTIRA